MSTCVYALVSPAPGRLRLTGASGEKLRVVALPGVAAVVGSVGRVPAPSVRNLRRHAAVVNVIAQQVRAILPARFATIVSDDEELTLILRTRRATFRDRLRAVRSRTQMTLRLLREPESRSASFASQSRVTGRTRLRLGYGATQGTQYLQRRREVAARAKEVPGFEPIRAAVRRLVKDERVEKRPDVITVHHLIPHAAAEKYRTTVQRAADELGMRLLVTGPLPPYAFADNW